MRPCDQPIEGQDELILAFYNPSLDYLDTVSLVSETPVQSVAVWRSDSLSFVDLRSDP